MKLDYMKLEESADVDIHKFYKNLLQNKEFIDIVESDSESDQEIKFEYSFHLYLLEKLRSIRINTNLT